MPKGYVLTKDGYVSVEHQGKAPRVESEISESGTQVIESVKSEQTPATGEIPTKEETSRPKHRRRH